MNIKKILRSFGYDIRRYHSLYDTVLKHREIQTVLDIGANDGHWSAEIRTLLPHAHIHAFEPLKDCFERANRRFASDPHFKSFNIALGDSDGYTEIERSSFHPSSSLRAMAKLHKELYPKSAGVTREKIRVRRLDAVATECVLAPDILIKMDVQGFEDKVIEGGRETFKKAAIVIAEVAFVRLYENQPLFGDIHNLMRGLGFAYHGNCAEHFSSKTGERIYEDAVFVRL
ncbi:hypothetical protein A2673_00080 [Candidatus Kaiserbacteria bacterium RIFCSPHIGHO2_01_FULL_50_13]|uniref:Methyltransferase FkbM domain-containing protein n=1 Tax=Candidatus Kaiserbacteria bacterium RIFCSPLOWO2_01_FULL_50_24 TaxID=1798507 RepID=A0A1F6EIV9_9BACT|nr:MAG: hypothetical protein A2673_00080 [Candidatus Kaiserbacteria bacterium RIFCSPHIGHO2_01_FULL_50_13]OGG73583.1 MAG: hypothetical protein A3A34_02815 [Candidatus Kaiserbacteria bacterium RIFCSPLOWO2_01_FULL_50_24]OGG81247.1 MAG: hypothetical protein A3H74_03675 [Candidatus Kaiserbacteria bacterium RIFCSPLOWO2_02_FULL_51_13]